MSSRQPIPEPPVDPLADTNPSLTALQPVRVVGRESSGWRRGAGLLSLLVAAGLTVATAILLTSPNPDTTMPVTALPPEVIPTAAVTESPVLDPTPLVQDATFPGELPTISPQQMMDLLSIPPQPVADFGSSIEVVRDVFNPFTIVRERPRSEVIQYTVVQGDTISTIAARFNLKPESIAWSNPRRIVLVLRPGDVINIPPVDGVYHQVVGSRTIAEIAASYKVNDPYVVIDSEYNSLFGTPPDTILPSGTYLFIPGGEGEQITWSPGVTVEQSGARRGYVTQFAAGDPGSCGNVENPGGGAAWVNPLPGGTYTRGFTSWHSGIDLAASPGTPIRAANSGAVIFAGWNSWGYGNTVVLAHGPFLTLYGHMSSISVRCGQYVPAGSVIGGVGSTGNSSGPHLHFEIRSGDTVTDPLATIPSLGL